MDKLSNGCTHPKTLENTTKAWTYSCVNTTQHISKEGDKPEFAYICWNDNGCAWTAQVYSESGHVELFCEGIVKDSWDEYGTTTIEQLFIYFDTFPNIKKILN